MYIIDNGWRQIEILGRILNFLAQCIFCRSQQDESIGGFNSEFYYLEHLKQKI